MKRIEWLDGIKGIAAMGVFTHHFLLGFLQSTYSGNNVSAHVSAQLEYGFAQSPLSVVVNGNFLVCVFCLISAIVMSLQTMRLKDKSTLVDILLKRYFKLMIPVFFVCLIIYIMINTHMFGHVDYAKTVLDSTWLANYYTESSVPLNKVFSSALYEIWLRGDTTFSSAFWMLNILFIGSYISICLSCIYWKGGKKSIWVSGVMAWMLWCVSYKYYAIFALGTLMAGIYKEYVVKKNKIEKSVGIFMCLLGLFLGGFPTGVVATNVYMYLPGQNLLGYDGIHIIGAVFVIGGIYLCGSIYWLETKLPQFLGRISYWIYLVHFPIIFSVSVQCFKGIYSMSTNYLTALVVTYIMTVVTILLSCLILENTVGKFTKHVTNYIVKIICGD